MPIVLAVQIGSFFMSDVIKNRDSDLFNRIASYKGHALYDFFRPKRNRALRDRGHDFILPRVKTELFKRAFLNRCLIYFFIFLYIFSLISLCNLIFVIL